MTSAINFSVGLPKDYRNGKVKKTTQERALCHLRYTNGPDERSYPAEKIFPKPRPSNLITVPACFPCNNSASQLDERFAAHLGIHVGGRDFAQAKARQLFDGGVLPTLKHNNRLRDSILKEVKPANEVMPQANLPEGYFVGKWDNEAHNAVLDRIVRGLNYYHYDKILGKNSEVSTYFFNEITDEMLEMTKGWNFNSIGNGQFAYRYAGATNGIAWASAWIFGFFGGHWAGGSTITPLKMLEKDA